MKKDADIAKEAARLRQANVSKVQVTRSVQTPTVNNKPTPQGGGPAKGRTPTKAPTRTRR